MGLTGSDNFSLKVSDDGTAWTEALVANGADGFIGIGTNAPERELHCVRGHAPDPAGR